MLTERNHTYLGRYNNIKVDGFSGDGYRKPREDRYINLNEVITDFSGRIQDVLSVGCSQGINEVLEAIRFPDKRFTCIDINPEAIEIARAGRWKFNDVAPYVRLFGSEKDIPELMELYKKYCTDEYFHMDVAGEMITLKKPVPNMTFKEMNATRTDFPNASFNLVISHFFDGKPEKHSMNQYNIGFEIERLLPDNGLFWNQEGCYIYKRSGLMGHFERVKKDMDGNIIYNPVDRSELFHEPESSQTPDNIISTIDSIAEDMARQIMKSAFTD